MARYTWSKTELYNQNGIQIFVIRAKEDNHKVVYELIENGVARNVKRAEVNPYLDPDYEKRKERRAKAKATMRANRAKYGTIGNWSEDLDFSWM